jgi:hypothetical protein
MIAVAIMPQTGRVLVMPLSATTWAGYTPIHQFFNDQKKEPCSLYTDEYLHISESITKKLPNAAVRKDSLILVHDHDMAHSTPEVKQLVADKNMVWMMLPPWSPDLVSLRYAVFLNCKRWLETNKTYVWDACCKVLVQHLEGLHPDTLISDYLNRPLRVLDTQGRHIVVRVLGHC